MSGITAPLVSEAGPVFIECPECKSQLEMIFVMGFNETHCTCHCGARIKAVRREGQLRIEVLAKPRKKRVHNG
jgi:hypothetical protein